MIDEESRPYHPIANIFPMMTDEEFGDLKEDILRNGQIEPIWLHPDGSIIDGRNRHMACLHLNKKPKFQTWQGDGSLVSFVISLNLHRRHLTSSQKAAVALDILPMLEEEAKARMTVGINQHSPKEIFPYPSEIGQARDLAAEMTGTNGRYVSDAKAIKEKSPELFEQVKTGELTIPEAKKKARTIEIQEERQRIAQTALDLPPDDRWSVSQGDICTWETHKRYDFIITDPPYPKEYLNLYEVLASRAREWLKPGGLVIAMCGQSYLNQIYTVMDKYLTYYWTAAYFLPGQPTPLRQRQVNTSWKPLLIYGLDTDYKGKIFGDVFQSKANDKSFHKWGQSESGMYSIINQICLEGQTIFDPFCGASTTGVAALRHGCLFDGIDIDEETVMVSRGRLSEL